MDRAEEILREQLKIDKSVGFGKLMWELHKNTLKKCMQIYAEEQLLLHNVVGQSEQFYCFDDIPNEQERCKEQCDMCKNA